MRVANVRYLPVGITAGVVLVLVLLRTLLARHPDLDFVESWELLTHNARAKLALRFDPPISPNLAVIGIEDECISTLNQANTNHPHLGSLKWPWPRFVFARAIEECKAQDAAMVALDLFFLDLGSEGQPLLELGGLSNDEYLAKQLHHAGNVLLTTTSVDISGNSVELAPVPELFRTNASGIGMDGLPRWSQDNRERFSQTPAFVEDSGSGDRVWHIGLLLAARLAGVDLEKATVAPGRITLQVPGRGEVAIPVDANQRFYIDWTILPAGPRTRSPVEQESFTWLFGQGVARDADPKESDNLLKGKAVVIGSVASGMNAYDRGATPVHDNVPLLYSIVNVANSLLTGRFIHRAGQGVEFVLMVGCAALAALVGWRLRGVWGVAALLVGCAVYLGVAMWLYVRWRYWLPVVMPVGGSVAMAYVCLLSFRMVVEREHRASFGKVVSPNIFERLTKQPASVLSNTRAPVTVYFADLRGFTRFVEANHACTQARLREQHLSGAAAEAVVEAGVREGLDTVNLYIGRIADVVKAHDGTLDKYIGDCVMSFWGAPMPDGRHAENCVRAAIEVHRTIQRLNQARMEVNRTREHENTRRSAAGQPTLDLLAVLSVGSAINSGVATVGFMGSAAHLSNYTVFGREVNIASRLEHLAGADRILVTEATYREVQRDAPKLAETFVKLGPMVLEGVPEPVEVYEVPWRQEAGCA